MFPSGDGHTEAVRVEYDPKEVVLKGRGGVQEVYIQKWHPVEYGKKRYIWHMIFIVCFLFTKNTGM